MLKLFIENKDGSVETHYALNDITLSRQIVSNSLNVSLYANDEFVYKFRSDGLIFATPTGSTAYSMSSGGPIADCTLNDIIIVTPVCEHSFFSKSMIFSATDSLCCCIEDTPENSYIVVDGKVLQAIIIRCTDNRGEYIVGCRMLEDNEKIQEYVAKRI